MESLIIDVFLLHSITDEREINVLFEIMEKRSELGNSTIICSQRVYSGVRAVGARSFSLPFTKQEPTPIITEFDLLYKRGFHPRTPGV